MRFLLLLLALVVFASVVPVVSAECGDYCRIVEDTLELRRGIPFPQQYGVFDPYNDGLNGLVWAPDYVTPVPCVFQGDQYGNGVYVDAHGSRWCFNTMTHRWCRTKPDGKVESGYWRP